MTTPLRQPVRRPDFVRPALALLALGTVLVASGCAVWRLGQSAELVRRSEPLQQRPTNAPVRLLIVGDSTAVGTGASNPAHSLAGLIAQTHPQLWIENRSRDGARFADLPEQMAGAAAFDVVLVQAGGNDVIRMRGIDALRGDIERATERARELAPLVVLMPAGNVGNAPFFFPPLSWLMTQRSRRMHGIVAAAAARHGAVYVNLFKEAGADPFAQQPWLNASDGLHPSDSGYGVWLHELTAQAPALVQRLRPAG